MKGHSQPFGKALAGIPYSLCLSSSPFNHKISEEKKNNT